MILFCRSCKFVICMENVGCRLACAGAAMIICQENSMIYHVLMSSSDVLIVRDVRIAGLKRFWRYVTMTDCFSLNQMCSKFTFLQIANSRFMVSSCHQLNLEK